MPEVLDPTFSATIRHGKENVKSLISDQIFSITQLSNPGGQSIAWNPSSLHPVRLQNRRRGMFCNNIQNVFPWNIVTANRGAKITVNSNQGVFVLIK